MKILAIRFSNINSLAGSWEIDLTAPDFASAGIFAIVGATGAGKSTILDAVSLALYGRTPRIRQISKSANDLMTHNTGQCSAELEFVSVRGHFRCHWSQHRARRQPTGELQQPRHEISDAATGIVLETKMKEVARKVIEATGMDFDQFTRSMLLAQGEFNKFLQASADDRAPILEQITGTGIYSRISKQVHELTARSKQQLDHLRQELSGYKLLSKEEEQKVTTELQELGELVGKLQQRQQQLQTSRNWLLSIHKLTTAFDSLQQELELLDKAKLEFAPQLKKLENGTAAQNISGCYRQLRDSLQLQEKDTQLATDLKQQLGQLDKQIAEQKEGTVPLQHNYQRVSEELQKAQVLLREVAQLDQLCNRLAKDQDEQKHLLQENQAAVKAKLENIAALQQKAHLSANTAAAAKIYLEAHDRDRRLHAELSGLSQLIKSLVQVEKELAALHTARHQTQEKLSALKKTATTLQDATAKTAVQLQDAEKVLETRQKALEVMPLLNELYTVREKLLEQFQKTQMQLKLCAELDAAAAKRKQVETNLGDSMQQSLALTKKIEQQTSELHHLQQLVEREEEIVLLAAKIRNFAQERRLLQDGSPCPLCGSTSHPYVAGTAEAHGKNPHERLKKSKEKLESCRTQRDETRDLLAKFELQNTKYQETRDELATWIQQGEEQLHVQLVELDNDVMLKEVITSNAEKVKRLLAEQERSIQQREEAEQSLGLARKQSDEAAKEHLKLEKQYESIRLQIENLMEQQRIQENDYASKQDSFNTELHTLQANYPDFATVEQGSQAIQRVLAALETRSRLYEEAKLKHSNSLQEEKHFQDAAQNNQTVLKDMQSGTGRLETKIAELGREMRVTAERRIQLFGEKAVDQEEKRLQQQVTNAETALRKHLQGVNELEKSQATMAERRKLCEEAITTRAIKVAELQTEFAALLAKHGFVDEQQYLTALLPEEEYTGLTRQAQVLERRTTQTQTLYARTATELQQEKEKHLCNISLPELEHEIEENNSTLAEKQQQTGGLQRSLEEHRKSLARFQDRRQLLSRMEKDYEYWWRLHALIGSADGKKFRNFAQGITFELMIRHANRQLMRMSDRYILVRSSSSPLDLQVIDNYQGGETRTTANLSGGESFIVSLALALGLASMAGNNIRVDTLFLDEGFGTLDEEALDVALDTLSSLHQEGKLIGIISHVHLLRERIGTQLRLTAAANGRSSLTGPGVKRL